MLRLVFALIAFLFFTGVALAQNIPDPAGYWNTEDHKAVIHVQRCDEGLCGTVHWLAPDNAKFDKNDPLLPICGMKILYGFQQQQDDPAEWDDGHVYKASAGALYSGTIKMQDKDTMKLHGYIGISLFGKTTYWHRVDPAQFPACTKPEITDQMRRDAQKAKHGRHYND